MESIPATRRRHSADLKARALEVCAHPGASIARIALENGPNARTVSGRSRSDARTGCSLVRYAGGQRAAAVMSLIQSAKLNGHDPYANLKDVLERLPTHPASRIEKLLPHRWAAPVTTE